jgi:Transglutaminase-like superfamily/Bacterial transglutaminase-like N-terminal region
MILDASCQISYHTNVSIPAIMMLRPRSGYAQWITREEYAFQPHAPVVEYTDNFGNLCQRVLIPKGAFEVRCSCRAHTADTVDVEPKARFVPVQELPESALQFLLPSRYCQSDLLNELASSIVGQAPLGYQQVAAIEQWLRSEMRYVSGSSNAKTSAVETATSRTGVCRDYAHLGISLTRSLNIPARMVVGYLHGLELMDLHAWFEAFVGGRWFTFDGSAKPSRQSDCYWLWARRGGCRLDIKLWSAGTHRNEGDSRTSVVSDELAAHHSPDDAFPAAHGSKGYLIRIPRTIFGNGIGGC